MPSRGMMSATVLAALVASSGAFLISCRAGEVPDAGSFSEDQAKSLVVKAAAVCRSTEPGSGRDAAEHGNYVETIQPLLAAGRQALPALRSLASSPRLSPFERRLAEILASRIESPGKFEKVAPLFVPLPDDPWENCPLFKSHAETDHIRIRSLTPELMHPDDREAWQSYAAGPENADLQKVLGEYDKLLAAMPPEDYAGRGKLWERRNADLNDFSNKLRKKYPNLCMDGGPFRAGPRANPEHLLAWEEAMVRPVPWRMRRAFAAFVTRIGSESSIPALGQALRQAQSAHDLRDADRRVPSDMIREIVKVLSRWPGQLTLFEFSETIKSVKATGQPMLFYSSDPPESVKADAKRLRMQQEIGWAMAESAQWREFLKKAEADPALKEQVELMREAVRKYEALQIERAKESAEGEKPKQPAPPPPRR